MYSIKYAPEDGELVVSLAVDTELIRAAADTLLINLSVRVEDSGGRGNVVNLFNFPLADVRLRFAPNDSSRTGVVLRLPWNGRDRTGEPFTGTTQASYKAQLLRVRNGRRSFVGRGAFGSVPLAF